MEMNFNPDPTKRAEDVIFTCKTKTLLHPPLVFNNAKITQSIYQKHLGIILDSKLIFENHLNTMTTKPTEIYLLKVNNRNTKLPPRSGSSLEAVEPHP